MKTLWKGAVSFGLVNIPVNMYLATENKDIKFNYLHNVCTTPVQYQKYCPNCQREINNNELIRGYQYQKGSYVVINEEDLQTVAPEKSRTIDIQDFVNLTQVDPVFFDKTYYLEPAPGGEKAYTLIVEAMKNTGKIAVAKVFIRSKQSLAVLRARERVLIMETIFYPDEIRSADSINQGLTSDKLHENELKMAVSLIESLSTDFNPDKYQDNYRQALEEMLEARIAGKEIVTPVAEENPAKVVDLMEALKASIQQVEKKNQGKGKRSSAKKSSRTTAMK